MRLYNAQSCTPMGSSSIYVAPKGSPPRKDLPQSPTAFARNWKLQQRRRRNVAVESHAASKSSGSSSQLKATKITSACFDPFELHDGIHSSFIPFSEKAGDGHSGTTSVTKKLTPVVSAESNDPFAVCADADGFLAFPDQFDTRQVVFQGPSEGDLFNDASTWMTSSTLSTKFTTQEVSNTTNINRKQTLDAVGVFVASRNVATGRLGHPRDLRTTRDKRPDEVFVTFPRGSSKPVPSDVEELQWKQASDEPEAFDPFAVSSISPEPAVHERYQDQRGFDKENYPIQYLPRENAATNPNVTSSAGRRFQVASLISKKNASVPSPTVYPSQQVGLASSPNRPNLHLANDSAAADAARGRPARAQLNSMLSSRVSFASRPKAVEYATPSNSAKNASRRVDKTLNEEPSKLVKSGSKPLDVSNDHPLHRQLLSRRSVVDPIKEDNKSPSTEKAHASPSPHLGGVISSATLASGKALLKKKTAKAPSKQVKVPSAGAPGSFLAERVETARPEAVYKPRMESASPSLLPVDKDEANTVNERPSPKNSEAGKLSQGKALQDMLNARLGKKDMQRSGMELIGSSQARPKDDAMDKTVERSSEAAKHVSKEELPLKDDPKYAKYIKMLKMGLPMGAVKNAMERDGLDSSVMDGDHSAPVRASKPPDDCIPLKDDPKYAKYTKMLKMGLPMGAVKNAMDRDGLDSSVMDGDHSAPAVQKTCGGVPLKDDPKYAKYMKMIKMGLPMGAVKNAMERDGLDSSVMDGDHSAPAGGENAVQAGQRVTKAPKDKYRRTRVHWETHNTVRSNTVWAMVRRDPDVADLKVDKEEFFRLFQAESVKPASQQSQPGTIVEKGAVKVIDKKRANNGGITLARIKLTYEEIADAVESYDESALTQEQIRGILQYLPTSEERTAIRNYLEGSSIDTLCECEKFMVAIMTVKHAKRKLDAIQYIQKFSSSLEELRRDARLVQKACDEIMGSSRFRKVLGIVLNLGNRLNTSGPVTKEPAEAVTLDSLVKLNQPKAFDKKTTFLQYVASVVRRNNASLCHFKDDLAAVFIAEKILWESTLTELKRMESELESVRRLALYHALERDHSKMSSRGSVNGDSVAAMSIPSKLSVEEEINLLGKTFIGKFTLDAFTQMAAVVEEVDTAKTNYNALLLYFGEEQNTKAHPNDVFHTISTFSKDFEAALAAVVESEKAQLREAKRHSRKHAQILPSVSDESEGSSKSNGSFRKRVSSSMGGVLNELRKNTPKWRRRKHVP